MTTTLWMVSGWSIAVLVRAATGWFAPVTGDDAVLLAVLILASTVITEYRVRGYIRLVLDTSTFIRTHLR